jgi:hypothetical protein
VGGSGGRGALVAGGLLGLAGWSLFSLSLADERVQWAPLASPGAAGGRLAPPAFGLGLVAATAGWALVVRAAHLRALAPAGVLALAVVFAAIAAAAPGLLSSDVYAYIRLGRMAALFDANPFRVPPTALADAYVDDRWFMAQVTSPYGPLWIGIAAALAKLADLARLDFAEFVQLYRALATACHCLNAALAWRIAEALRPGSGAAAGAALALCPLAIVEACSGAHSDVFVAGLLLLGIAQQLRSRPRLASALFAAASLIKLYALLAWGVHALLVWRSAQSRAEAARLGLALGLVAAALAALAYLPFWEGPATLGGLRMLVGLLLGLAPTNSLAEWIGVHGPWPARLGAQLAGALCAGAFLATAGALAAATRDAPSFVRALLGGFFAWSAFGASWNQPWYALAAVAVAAIAPPSRLRAATWLLSATLLAIYPLRALELPAVFAHRALAMEGLPLACLGLGWLADRAGRGPATGRSPPPREPRPGPEA